MWGWWPWAMKKRWAEGKDLVGGKWSARSTAKYAFSTRLGQVRVALSAAWVVAKDHYRKNEPVIVNKGNIEHNISDDNIL